MSVRVPNGTIWPVRLRTYRSLRSLGLQAELAIGLNVNLKSPAELVELVDEG